MRTSNVFIQLVTVAGITHAGLLWRRQDAAPPAPAEPLYFVTIPPNEATLAATPPAPPTPDTTPAAPDPAEPVVPISGPITPLPFLSAAAPLGPDQPTPPTPASESVSAPPPAPSEAPAAPPAPASVPAPAPTGQPDTSVPIANVQAPPAPDAAPAVTSEQFARNVAQARQLNVLYAGITLDSACAPQQVACLQGATAVYICSSSAAWTLHLACPMGPGSCAAMPLENVVDGIMVGCVDPEHARTVLGSPVPTSRAMADSQALSRLRRRQDLAAAPEAVPADLMGSNVFLNPGPAAAAAAAAADDIDITMMQQAIQDAVAEAVNSQAQAQEDAFQPPLQEQQLQSPPQPEPQGVSTVIGEDGVMTVFDVATVVATETVQEFATATVTRAQ